MFSSIAVLLVVGVFLFLKFQITKMEKVIAILIEGGEPRLFIKEFQKFIDKAKRPVIVNCLLINRAAGVFYSGHFQEAINSLESLDPERLPTMFYLIYYYDLLEFYLMSGQYERAKSLYDDKYRVFIRSYNLIGFTVGKKL